MSHHRVLAVTASSTADLLRSMRRTLDARDFDPGTMFVGPRETRLHPARAVRLRLSVLMRTYHGDYHTDSFELDRLCAQIERGDEHIWFWGAPDQVAAARAELARPRNGLLPDLALGTVTVLSAEDEFGPGHGELCRSASVDRTVGAVAAILHRMIGYHDGSDRDMHDRYHTLLLAARNRASTATVRGGEAVQHIHCRHVQSQFWGLAPFYVMQGGVLECTELRESSRDPQQLHDGRAACPTWWFADLDDADYAEALWRLNIGTSLDARTAPAPEAPSATPTSVIAPPSAALVTTNHTTLRPASRTGPGQATDGFGAAVGSAERSGVCCVVVQLPLDDPDRLADQAWLAARGYVLTAISPPKRGWRRFQGVVHRTASGPMGIWCRPRHGLAVIAPHYLHRANVDPVEAAVLAHLRRRYTALRSADPTAVDR